MSLNDFIWFSKAIIIFGEIQLNLIKNYKSENSFIWRNQLPLLLEPKTKFGLYQKNPPGYASYC